MDLMLGLPNLNVLRVSETLERMICTLEVGGDPPPCPSCGSHERRHHGTLTRKVWDTPTRGKPTQLVFRRQRYQCRCAGTYVSKGAIGVHDKYPSMTTRLVRYIQNAVLRRPLTIVAAETGVSRTNVRLIATHLAQRLYDDHRFPTPEVLAIDDLRIRKKLFTVVTDGQTGKPIALVVGGDERAINAELGRRRVDPTKVRVFVSDLGGANLAVYESMFRKHGAIHVADKWHILQGVQKALSLVINKRIDHLRRRRAWCEKILKKRGRPPSRHWTAATYLVACQERIDQLLGAKKPLLGARITQSAQPQLSFDINVFVIKPALKRHPTVGKAFWAKMRLHMVYSRSTRGAANAQIDRFLKRASARSIAPQMETIVKRVRKNRQLILNYFTAMTPNTQGKLTAPTTGPTERRNGSIKTAWKSGRGLHKKELFSMRALYEPWQLDVDIGVCSHPDCDVVEGPYPNRTLRLSNVVGAGYRHYCPQHTPP